MKAETEPVITAAQDQALNTKSHKTKFMKISNVSKFKLSTSMDETREHVLSGCQVLAGTEYIKRPNEVAKLLHRNLWEKCGVKTQKEGGWTNQNQSPK